MVQEYLFTEQINIEELPSADGNEGEWMATSEFGKTGAMIVSYHCGKENEKTAIRLSMLNEEIIVKFKPYVLTNEASAYFNKRLYPLFNEFERKLRKIIYLATTYTQNEDGKKVADSIEKDDFGKIFDKLFTDEVFIKNVKSIVNDNGHNHYSKTEILQKLHKQEENTLWDKLVGNDNVSSLTSNYLDVKDFRNDVMHAHNINHTDYKIAKRLIKKINSELDVEIGKFLNKDKSLDTIDFAGIIKGLTEFSNYASKIVGESLVGLSKTAALMAKFFEKMYPYGYFDNDEENEELLKLDSKESTDEQDNKNEEDAIDYEHENDMDI